MDRALKQIELMIKTLDLIEYQALEIMEDMGQNPEYWNQDAKDDMDQVRGYIQDAIHDLMDASDQYGK